jgi:hypothetical protein
LTRTSRPRTWPPKRKHRGAAHSTRSEHGVVWAGGPHSHALWL